MSLDASQSSQFVSALLLSGAHFDDGLRVQHRGEPVPSAPHIEMTLRTLEIARAEVGTLPDGWSVGPGPLAPLDIEIEPDLSGAAPFLAAAAVTGGSVHIPRWPGTTTQAGDLFRDILVAAGAKVALDSRGLTVAGGGELAGVDVDLHAAGELTPVVAAMAALASSPSCIRGVGHIRGHETDRLAALSKELSAVGAKVSETSDGLVITPGRLVSTRFHTYADHRMVMAGAVLGLAVPGIVLDDVSTVAKTMPEFPDLWKQMLGEAQSEPTPALTRTITRPTS